MFSPGGIAIDIVKRGCWRYMLYDIVLTRDCNAAIFVATINMIIRNFVGDMGKKRGNSDVTVAIIFRTGARSFCDYCKDLRGIHPCPADGQS